jgi:hypothetical protein
LRRQTRAVRARGAGGRNLPVPLPNPPTVASALPAGPKRHLFAVRLREAPLALELLPQVASLLLPARPRVRRRPSAVRDRPASEPNRARLRAPGLASVALGQRCGLLGRGGKRARSCVSTRGHAGEPARFHADTHRSASAAAARASRRASCSLSSARARACASASARARRAACAPPARGGVEPPHGPSARAPLLSRRAPLRPSRGGPDRSRGTSEAGPRESPTISQSLTATSKNKLSNRPTCSRSAASSRAACAPRRKGFRRPYKTRAANADWTFRKSF